MRTLRARCRCVCGGGAAWAACRRQQSHSQLRARHGRSTRFTQPAGAVSPTRSFGHGTGALHTLHTHTVPSSQARVEFDQTIQETEAAYMKILESSQTLLGVLKRESTTLTKKKTASS